MKRMQIFDPAMCCSTGVCGPGVDPELLRVATTLNNLKTRGVNVERYNLSQAPAAFVENKTINELLNAEGVEILPVTLLEGQVVKTKAYPTNQEFVQLLEVSEEYLQPVVKKVTVRKSSKGCGCNGGCC